MFAVGCKNTLTIAIPLSDCDSMCSILSTVVVRARSVMLTIRSAISSGTRPLKVQIMLTTGMLMFGNISVGVRTIASVPMMRMSMATTTNVYGLRRASRTIHMNHSIASAPSEGSRNITFAIKHPVFHRYFDERQSSYHATGEAVKDTGRPPEQKEVDDPPDAPESAGGHESEFRQRELTTQINGRINLAVEWALVTRTKRRRPQLRPLALSFR